MYIEHEYPATHCAPVTLNVAAVVETEATIAVLPEYPTPVDATCNSGRFANLNVAVPPTARFAFVFVAPIYKMPVFPHLVKVQDTDARWSSVFVVMVITSFCSSLIVDIAISLLR